MYHVDCEATTLSPLLDISIKLYCYFLLNSSPVTSYILIYDINAAVLQGWYLLAFASSLYHLVVVPRYLNEIQVDENTDQMFNKQFLCSQSHSTKKITFTFK